MTLRLHCTVLTLYYSFDFDHFVFAATTIDRRVELDSEGREWFKGVRGITGDLPDEFYLDDKTDLPKHLRWRVDLPERVKKRKVEVR